jgi:hypothetical protein
MTRSQTPRSRLMRHRPPSSPRHLGSGLQNQGIGGGYLAKVGSDHAKDGCVPRNVDSVGRHLAPKIRSLLSMHSQSVFTLSDFHRMTADADISDLVAMFFGAGIYMTGTLHLYALLNMQGLS